MAVIGQMCRSPNLTPEDMIDRYAGLIAEGETRAALGRVLRFLENHSNWQNSLPAAARLPDLPLPDVPSAAAALDLLAQVRPSTHPAIPLSEPPALYFGRLKKRLEAVAAGNSGGMTPIKENRHAR